nr:hypothetical protein CFP56_05144 [Quercus suber]
MPDTDYRSFQAHILRPYLLQELCTGPDEVWETALQNFMFGDVRSHRWAGLASTAALLDGFHCHTYYCMGDSTSLPCSHVDQVCCMGDQSPSCMVCWPLSPHALLIGTVGS